MRVFQEQLDAERNLKLGELQHELEQERQKHQVTLNRQEQEFIQHSQQQALKNGAKFATILLQKTASQELEARFVQLLLEQLVTLPDVCQLYLQRLENQQVANIKITSAYPLSPILQQQVEQHFANLVSMPLVFDYQQDAALIAGLRIEIGAWVLQANVKHELSGFAEFAYDFE